MTLRKKCEKPESQRASYDKASKSQYWDYLRSHSLLPTTVSPITIYHAKAQLLWTHDYFMTVEAYVIFNMLQKCRVLSGDSVIFNPTQQKAGTLDHASHSRRRHISFALLSSGYMKIVIVVILSQLFDNVDTRGKCQSNVFPSHYMPVFFTSTQSIHLPFLQGH